MSGLEEEGREFLEGIRENHAWTARHAGLDIWGSGHCDAKTHKVTSDRVNAADERANVDRIHKLLESS